MRNGKGTVITIVVIAAVILLGVVLWWSQNSNLSGTTEPTASSTPAITESAGDTTTDIQMELDKIDTGSTTEDLIRIDSDINSL